jgi:prepilin-type N-terminal cleavage/methylation domain-containing protein
VIHRHRRRAGSPGFTLVEMATVLTLIGVLTVLAIVTTRTLIQRARAQATATQMVFMRTGLLNLATSCEGLPRAADSGGDPGLAYQPVGTACWSGPYLAHWPASTSFGRDTRYRYRTGAGGLAQLSAEALKSGDALALASEVAPRFAGQARLIAAEGQWAVAVDIGTFYPR